MPYWDPLMPPMGISCLKSYLARSGYTVKTVDANIEGRFKEVGDKYFDVLRASLPPDKQSNFYNIGKEVFRYHQLVHLHQPHEKKYSRMVKLLIRENFYSAADDATVQQLNLVMDQFYAHLEQYILSLLEKEKPGLLGLSVFQGTAAASLYAFKKAKGHYPEIQTIMGGGIFADQLAPDSPNFELFLEKTPYIDKFFIGESEILFLKYLQGELPGNRRIYGLGAADQHILDISSFGQPDFSGLSLDYYPHLGAYTSRGCPFMCGFCSETVMWKKYRKKKAHQVVKELDRMFRQYGSQLFLMSDSLLNPTASELAAAVRESPVPFYWDGYLRVDKNTCDSEQVWQWRRGGFYRARLGVESGSPKVLDLMKKHITPDQIRETLITLADMGIKTTTYWVIGYPGETEADFCQTLDLVEEMSSEIYEADCNPFNYFYSGQVNSKEWAADHYLLYPQDLTEAMILQKWELNCSPSRQERYDRLRRFSEHCRKLGIPDPYTLYDISRADKRWQKLHKNAVPPAAVFKDSSAIIDECRKIGKPAAAVYFSEKITFNI